MRDGNGRIVVMDFGLARSLESGGMTQTGMMVGTLEYMSPEQACGKGIDTRSDLYAVGLIFFELLTGKMPFQAETALASLLKRAQERATPASEVDHSIPTALSAIVAKCLESDPARRYQTAGEILDALAAWRGVAPITTFHPSRITIPEARKTWQLAAVAVVAVGLIAASVWFLRGRSPAASHPPVSLLIADFENRTGDSVFDGTVEPALGLALEGASFVSSYNRGEARREVSKLRPELQALDVAAARLVATRNAVNVVIGGSIEREGDGFQLTARAVDAMTGKVIADSSVHADSKDGVLRGVGKLAARLRKALGDSTPESAQLAAAETFTAGSLEAAHQYSVAQELAFAGKHEEALRYFTRATELDPGFGRAYAGMAAVYRNLRQRDQAEKYFKLAMEHVDRMTERERYRVRGAYYVTIGEYQKCVDEYSPLIKKYPADNIGHVNLAVCYARLKNMASAVEEARRAVEISPRAAMPRMNLSLYASYAGDFATSEREAREVLKLNPAYEKGYLALAYAQLGQGQAAQAAETYQKLDKISALGASYAKAGLADLALYEGRFAEAAQLFEQGAAADLAANRLDRAAANLAALAYLQQVRGQRPTLDTIEKALADSKAPKLRFLAGRLLIAAGATAKARELGAELASEPQSEPQAYAKLLAGEAALQAGNARQAIKEFTEANSTVDTWIGRFDLGRAYLEAEMFVEADSEFDRCLTRRGEAMELFADDMPTYGYVPPVYYYQGRVREGMKSAGSADSYRTYLSIRGKAGEDPLLAQVRQRAGQ